MKWSGRNRCISSVLALKPKVVVDYVITVSNINKYPSVNINVDYVLQQETNRCSAIRNGFEEINMVDKWVKVIAAIVIVSILIFILYFAYDGNARRHETVTKIQWAKTSLKMHAFWLNINRLVIQNSK